MKEWIRENNLWNDNTILYGIAHDNEITWPAKCRYDVSLVVPPPRF